MASRENTGLQVALILFVIMTVVLGVTTYLYFRKAEENLKAKQSADQKLQTAQESRDKALFQVQFLRHIIGYEPKDAVEYENVMAQIDGVAGVTELETSFKNARAMYGVGLDDNERTNLYYQTMPEKLITTIRSLHKQIDDLDKIHVSLNEDYKEQEASHKVEIDKLQTQLADVRSNYSAFQTDFNSKLVESDGKRVNLQGTLTKRDQEKRQLESRLDEETKVLSAQLETTGVHVETLQEKLRKLQDRSFESPDGRISAVNQAAGIVYINLGSADGLKRQVTFSVYDQDENAVAKAEPKGRIEVTEITGPHEAVARVLEDETTNPILPQDNIFSPAWSPGTQVHFALAGIMDIDDDGADDRIKVRNIITMSGGVIDAELRQDGTETGELTYDTTYIVRGAPPTEKSNAAYQQAYSGMMSRAREKSIEVISVSKLLNIMGWKPEERTITLGGGRGGSDYRPRTKKGPAATDDGFQQRRPPAGTRPSAFD